MSTSCDKCLQAFPIFRWSSTFIFILNALMRCLVCCEVNIIRRETHIQNMYAFRGVAKMAGLFSIGQYSYLIAKMRLLGTIEELISFGW